MIGNPNRSLVFIKGNPSAMDGWGESEMLTFKNYLGGGLFELETLGPGGFFPGGQFLHQPGVVAQRNRDAGRCH